MEAGDSGVRTVSRADGGAMGAPGQDLMMTHDIDDALALGGGEAGVQRRSPARLSATAIFALFATIGLVQAQPAVPVGQSARQACRADYQAVCSGVPFGGGRVIACLKQNYSNLSPGCQAALSKSMSPR